MAQIPSRYRKAQSVEEVAELLRADGADASRAEQAWKEICAARELEGECLSLDELDAAAGGGVEYRDWYSEGCTATVEPGSDCFFTDGGCTSLNISYFAMPGSQRCVLCGAGYTFEYDVCEGRRVYACRECRRFFTFNKQLGTWEETAKPAGLVM